MILVRGHVAGIMMAVWSLAGCGGDSGQDSTGASDQAMDKAGAGPFVSPTSPSEIGGVPGQLMQGCVEQAIDIPAVCAASNVFNEKAGMVCSWLGLQLNFLALSQPCGPGQWHNARFACCPGGIGARGGPDVPSAQPSMPAPPTPSACAGGAFSSPCAPEADLKQKAATQCKVTGLQLIDFQASDSCGPGLFRMARFGCCGSEPNSNPGRTQPAPIPACNSGAIGDMNTCLKDDDLRIRAMEMCSRGGSGMLVDFATDRGCDNGLSRMAKYTCCSEPSTQPMDPQPPVQNQPVCAASMLESPERCLADWEWKQQIVSLCESKGLRDLRAYATDGSCGPGSSHAAKFECCAMPGESSSASLSAYAPAQ